MLTYLARRALWSIVTLLACVLVVFVGVRALPGDAALAFVGDQVDPELLEAIRGDLGLDEPLPVQFVSYLRLVAQGELGNSARDGLPVADTIARALPVTLELAVLSVSVAVVVGVGLGTVAAVYRNRTPEWLANTGALLGLSIPNFWLGMMLILVFAVTFPILPASGFVPISEGIGANLRHMIAPATVLGTSLAAVTLRQTRSAMIDALASDYARTARARGLSRRRVVLGHALPNSLVVGTTIVGLQLGTLLAGAVITEEVFVMPGFGKLMIDSVLTRDYPLIQGVVLVAASGYILVNFATDLLYTLVDPRIRVGRASRT